MMNKHGKHCILNDLHADVFEMCVAYTYKTADRKTFLFRMDTGNIYISVNRNTLKAQM